MNPNISIPGTPSIAHHAELIRGDILRRFQNGDTVYPENVTESHKTVQDIARLCIDRMHKYHQVKEEKSRFQTDWQAEVEKVEKLQQEKDTLLQERDALLQDKDTLLQDKDTLLQEKDKLIQEKDLLKNTAIGAFVVGIALCAGIVFATKN